MDRGTVAILLPSMSPPPLMTATNAKLSRKPRRCTGSTLAMEFLAVAVAIAWETPSTIGPASTTETAPTPAVTMPRPTLANGARTDAAFLRRPDCRHLVEDDDPDAWKRGQATFPQRPSV